jgi:hypothetical protein
LLCASVRALTSPMTASNHSCNLQSNERLLLCSVLSSRNFLQMLSDCLRLFVVSRSPWNFSLVRTFAKALMLGTFRSDLSRWIQPRVTDLSHNPMINSFCYYEILLLTVEMGSSTAALALGITGEALVSQSSVYAESL